METQVTAPNGGKGSKWRECTMANRVGRLRRWFAELDVFSAFLAFLTGTSMEPRPIPVKTGRRR